VSRKARELSREREIMIDIVLHHRNIIGGGGREMEASEP